VTYLDDGVRRAGEANVTRCSGSVPSRNSKLGSNATMGKASPKTRVCFGQGQLVIDATISWSATTTTTMAFTDT
jgi:hypothetical protein